MLGIITSSIGYATPPKFVQEAEIKHGRVAMLSSVAIPVLDHVNPDILGVNFVNSLDSPIQLGLLGIVGVSEAAQIFKAYNFPNEVSDWFTMKDSHEPGNYSFDPLGISKGKDLTSNEMFIGRLAMIGVAIEMAQELGVGEKVF